MAMVKQEMRIIVHVDGSYYERDRVVLEKMVDYLVVFVWEVHGHGAVLIMVRSGHLTGSMRR